MLVANDRSEFLASLNEYPKVYDRFKQTRSVHFDRYDAAELATIVNQRVREGLQASAVQDEAIKTIAAVASNARGAVQILRSAAQHVGDRGRLAAGDVVEAVPEAREILRDHALSRLGHHPQELFRILDEQGPMRYGDFYAEYDDCVADTRSKSSASRYLQKLRNYDCVEYDDASSMYSVREVPGGVPAIPV